jgi:cysteine desulfurase
MFAPAYFDHNATTPLDATVRDAMLPYLDGRFGNASSRQRVWACGRGVPSIEARQRVACCGRCPPD